MGTPRWLRPAGRSWFAGAVADTAGQRTLIEAAHESSMRRPLHQDGLPTLPFADGAHHAGSAA